MKPDSAPKTIFLQDYRPPSHVIDSVHLHFALRDNEAIVTNTLQLRRNTAVGSEAGPLALDGEEIELLSVRLDGRALAATDYEHHNGKLHLPTATADAFELEIKTRCEPQKNLAFEGLYRSSGMFCTQCEAEGFRRITFFLDRPDVMTVFRVTLEADASKYPVLLSNGNLVSKRALEGGRHEAVWDDPFKKPCYLFAMVAGDLGCLKGEFIRRSGRPVALEIYCQKGLEDRCRHALDSLKHAMKWDEDVFGLEYDLDVYMIVVANDFNMGAMENKGLNVFNSNYVLAKPETATDSDYEGIMAVVGHEYFHNWTGNRVTCRDWFQLSLKEGLTVFRDQQFSGDMGSEAVNRIEDVIRLRQTQFAEDAGPMAHPIRPSSYITINNFYTATVYEKGSEVIRMIRTILGPEAFRRGMDLYFARHDGQAVTTEDFVAAMEAAGGIDLSQFKNWYDQAGTPAVRAQIERTSTGETRLHLVQTCAPSPGQPVKKSYHIPFSVGFLDRSGRELPLRLSGEPAEPGSTGLNAPESAATTRLLHLIEAEQTFSFVGLPADAVPSLLRGFSAPINLSFNYNDNELAFLIARDSDPFSRWEAAQILAMRELKRLVGEHQAGRKAKPTPDVLTPFAEIAREAVKAGAAADQAFISLMLFLPSEQYLAQKFETVDPEAIHTAREALRLGIAIAARADLELLYTSLQKNAATDAIQVSAAGRRSLKNRCLDYLCLLDEPLFKRSALTQMQTAKCMTDELGALSALVRREGPEREQALGAFYAKWKHEPLVMNKWLSLQATSPARDTLERVRRLAGDPVFDRTNPNKIYSLFRDFAAGNLVRFHDRDGAGYRFLADQILDIESRNPQVAARLMSAFNQWRRFDSGRQVLMRQEIARVLAKPGLSSDIFEIGSKALA